MHSVDSVYGIGSVIKGLYNGIGTLVSKSLLWLISWVNRRGTGALSNGYKNNDPTIVHEPYNEIPIPDIFLISVSRITLNFTIFQYGCI